MLTHIEIAAFERSIKRFEIVVIELEELLRVCDESNRAHYQRQLEEKSDVLICLKAELREFTVQPVKIEGIDGRSLV